MTLDAAKWAANMLTMLLPRTRKRKDVQCVIKDAGLKSKRSGKKKKNYERHKDYEKKKRMLLDRDLERNGGQFSKENSL